MPSAQAAATIAPPAAEATAPPAAWRGRARAVAMPIGFFALLLGFWEAYVRITGIPAVILPGATIAARWARSTRSCCSRRCRPRWKRPAASDLLRRRRRDPCCLLSRLWREAVYPTWSSGR